MKTSRKGEKHMPTIRFMPMGIDVPAREGEKTIAQVAARLGIGINQPCGGFGTCGKCRVLVSGASSSLTEQEERMLTPGDIESGYRLACRCPVEDGLTVFIGITPAEGRGRGPGMTRQVRYGGTREPLFTSISFDLDIPSVRDKVSSFSEIAASAMGLSGDAIPIGLMDPLQRIFSGNKPGKAVISNRRLVALEAGDSFKPYGLATDVGTTSLVLWLVDLEEGSAVDALSDLNPQVRFGADVLTRMSHITKKKDGLFELRDSLLSALNRMIGCIARRNGISPGQICAVTVAGNTCMEHIFAGVDPSSIGKSPFIPPYRAFPRLDAVVAGLEINPLAEVIMIPNISGYVGGDITAGIEASGMTKGSGVTLFVDIGTNSEIVLGNRDFLISCSAAAGPAFEGARISCGMRAAMGAIERVSVVDGRLSLGVIGGTEPAGICGSGIIDLVSEMLRQGLVDPSGKMSKGPFSDIDIHICVDERGMRHLVLAGSEDGSESNRLVFTQKDVREVQLAKGAIATGIQALLEMKGLQVDDLCRVVVGGAFGNFLNPVNAISIGVLPMVPIEKIEFMGNTSIIGAFHALVSREDHAFMEKLPGRVEYLELSTFEDFQARFLANLRLGPVLSRKE